MCHPRHCIGISICYSYFCPFPYSESPFHPPVASSLLQWILICLKDASLDQILRLWSVVQLLLQAICPHVTLQLLLMCLQCGCGVRVWKDVAFVHQYMNITDVNAVVGTYAQPDRHAQDGAPVPSLDYLSLSDVRGHAGLPGVLCLHMKYEVSLLLSALLFWYNKEHTVRQSCQAECACS